jgi:hypothetical protein
MSYAVTVKVSNHGSHDVRLQTSVAEFIGPRTGSVITAANADGASPDGIDALYKLTSWCAAARPSSSRSSCVSTLKAATTPAR